MATIFVSYSHSNRDEVARLKDGIVLAGSKHEFWIYTEQIRLADRWLTLLEGAQQSCAAFVVVVGQCGITGWVELEVETALQRHVESGKQFPILPILLPGTDLSSLPSTLRSFQKETLPVQMGDQDYLKLAHRIDELLAGRVDGQRKFVENLCPWPGLLPYDYRRAALFFGRTAEIQKMLNLLGHASNGSYCRWLQIEGPSGVGKSSFIHAGLLPAMSEARQGKGPLGEDGREWVIMSMRPGTHPLDSLALSIADKFSATFGSTEKIKERLLHGGDDTFKFMMREVGTECCSSMLLVIDQFEELFTVTSRETDLGYFERLLKNALEDADGPLHLLSSIRSDFTLNQQERLPALTACMDHLVKRPILGSITKSGLREVVTIPAQLFGLCWSDPQLPENIVEEACEIANPLPLVSNLLWAMWWYRRNGRELSRRVYDDLQRVGGALSKSAEDFWNGLGEPEQKRAEELLLKLVSIGDDRADSRRTISRTTALAILGGDNAESLLTRLSGGRAADANHPPGPRLVDVTARSVAVPGDYSTVDLAHEALLTNWPRLSALIKDPDKRRQLEAEEALEVAARRWEKDGKPNTPGLPEPRMLDRFINTKTPSPLALEYLQALIVERQIVARRKRKLMIAIATLTSLVLAGAVWASIALWANSYRQSWRLGFYALQVRIASFFGWELIEEPKTVEIPPGQFEMGSEEAEDETPTHTVIISRTFKLGQYEVSFEQYDNYARSVDKPLPPSYSHRCCRSCIGSLRAFSSSSPGSSGQRQPQEP